ncbi:hemagglutinin repeat-containing protein [Fusobacterium animalis]|uniref:hemagglutinin repeat-containing protein n=1 Tax=Fusobacterium animalis TaxID=76859 RepID=UPI0030D5BA9C
MKGRLKRIVAIFMLILQTISLADGIVPDSAASKNLQIDKAANGVPLVNIEAPNQDGVSHNIYKDYNVDERGAILNNSKDLTNTQLGGLIYGNPNLQNSNEATTIINEVSGVNRSRIEGYQEIAGKRANYILANPNGIYINGAGFINTGNVTLTTGSGNNLLNPEKGTIEIDGKGLDLRNINKAELIARVAELSAPIYGGEEVNLKLGSKNNKPEYALDARALGSIYAGRINIIVNEDGVGVKTQAPMYATKGDVVISSRGKVYLKDTQAKGDIKISSAETEIGNKLLAENSINIESGKTSNSGEIKANNNIRFSGNVDSSNLISTNKDVTISGNLTNSGKILSKNINTKDLNNSGELYSENLTTTNLENSNKINIKENINSSNILNKTNNSEIISKNLNTSNLDNKGNVKIVNNVTSQEITNNGKLLVGNNLNAQNLANTSIIQGKVLNINNKINSSGKILSDSITTKDISNSGNISSKAITTQELTNSGEIISNSLSSNDVSNSKDIFVNGNLKVVNELNNNGVIEGLELNTNSIENTGNITIQNKLVAQKLNNKKNTANVNAGFLDVQNKVISIGNIKALAVKTKDLDNSGSILTNSLTTTESINKGNITSKDISTQNLVNSGDIKVGRNLNTDKLKNSKNIIAQNITIEKSLDNINGNISSLNTNINTSDIKNNNGIIQAVKNINIVTANDLNLDGKYTANDSLNINAKSLENNGDLENDGEIKFTLTGNLINNKKISSSGNLDITAKEISNNGTDSAIGSMTSLAITASSLKNEGNLLFGEGKENKLKTTGDINNTGVISSLGKLSIEAKDILNDKHIVSDNDLTVNANSITNKGLLYSTENMKVDFKNDFLNDRGEIYSGGDIAFTGKEGTFTNKVGDITSEGNIKIEAKDIKNLAEIKGYHKVVGSVPGNESNVDLSKIDMNKYYERSSRMMKEFYEKYVKKGRWTWFNNDHTGVYLEKADKIESHYTSEMSTIKADKNITLIATKDVENIESNILANGNININAQNLINKNFEIPVERKLTFLRDYEFHRPAENPGSRKTIDLTEGKVYMTGAWDKGSFIMDDKITTYLGTGKNAKISASGNINISANKVGNGALAKENVKIDSKKQDITSTKVDKNDINLDSIKNTNVDEIVLNKKNLEPKEEIDTKGYIILPKNDKGMFKINNNIDNKPGFSYLVETNINFIDKSRFYGSDYFFKRIGFNPDRNIRLLGDSFYETKLINRAILEGTGRRYLSGYVSEKEQMKALYDNAAIEQEDLKLSLGIALTKDQIAGLKKDIIWYVEEEIQGQKVLVPKVYLTRNTLSKLKNKNAAIEVGQNLVIAAKDIVNTGNLSANNIIITTDNLTNKSILGANKASIDGNSIAITAENSMNNIGADIKANENLVVTAKDISNLSTKRINGYEYDNISNLENSANIEGKNVTLTAKNDVVNTAASIKANESLKIEAKDVTINTLEENRYFYSGDGVKEYTKIDNKNNVSSDIEAKNIDITSKNDIDVKGSNIVAKEEANIKADGDINIVSATDSRYYAHKETHKKSFGRSKSEENISYATNNVSSNILGDKVNITSGKDVNILGSNVQANTEGEIKADRNMTQAGVKDINYSYHKTTKTGFMGLTSKSVTDENYAEKAILSATLSGDKGLTYDSKNDLLLEGVKVVSSGSINLKGNNVEINPLETKSYNKHEEVKKGFSGSFNSKGASLSYGKDKLESNTDIVNQTASQIVSNKDINIEASDKLMAKSVDIYAKNDVNISGDNGVEISTANNSYDNTTKQSSSRIGASVGINSAIVNTVENVRDIKNLTDFSGNSYDILNNTSKIVGAIKDGAKATIAVADTSYNGSTDAGYDKLKIMNDVFKANISYSKSKSKSSVHNETVEKSSLVSGNNMNIKSKNGNITISGTDVKVGKDLNLNAKKDVTIKASEENYTSSNSSSQTGISLTADLSKGKIGDLSISKAGAKGRGNGTNYVNSTIDVGGKLKTNSENLTLSGANVEADKLDIKAKNLVIESKQDKSERKDSSYGTSFSIDLANPTDFSANINGSKGNGEKEWTNKQTSLIARNGGKVDTDNLTNIGAVMGSESDKEKLKVSANKVVVKDLEDKNKYENIGGGITFGTDVPNTSIKHDKIDKEQINRATAINTDFEISGEKKSAEDLGFNTDIDKAQEVTKDEEKHLDAELHTDLLGEDKQEELKKAGGIIGDLSTALGNKSKTEGDFLERYKQLSMMRAIGDQVEKNPEYLSILEKEVRKNGVIDDDVQKEQVSVMNKLLNDALRAKGYKGPDIKMALTDVTDPNGPYYTDPLTNTVVFDRNELANANRDQILNALGHEFGHYSKEDNKTGSQTIANYSGGELEKRTKDIVSKEATEETLAEIRNNKNVITGEEGRQLAESIPMERREYEGYIYERDLNLYKIGLQGLAKGKIAHSGVTLIPSVQSDFFDKSGNLKEKYIKRGYSEPHKFPDGRLGWVEAGFKGEKSKGEPEEKLVIRINPFEDVVVNDNLLGGNNETYLTGRIAGELKPPKNVSDTQMIENIMEKGIDYKKSGNYVDYSALPQLYINLPGGGKLQLTGGYNCHSMTGTLTQGFEPYGNKRNNLPKQRGGEISDKDYNKYRYSPMIRVAPGLGNIIPEKYFRRVEE